jgi:hypothetical protein
VAFCSIGHIDSPVYRYQIEPLVPYRQGSCSSKHERQRARLWLLLPTYGRATFQFGFSSKWYACKCGLYSACGRSAIQWGLHHVWGVLSPPVTTLLPCFLRFTCFSPVTCHIILVVMMVCIFMCMHVSAVSRSKFLVLQRRSDLAPCCG